MRRQAADAHADGATQRGYITYDAFLDMVDEDSLAEWVAGAIVMTSPAGLRHQNLAGFLFSTLTAFVGIHTLGKVVAPPFQMKLPRSGREPDVIYVATAHLDRFTPTYLAGPADLVVEIISPESAQRDRVTKFEEYQKEATEAARSAPTTVLTSDPDDLRRLCEALAGVHVVAI